MLRLLLPPHLYHLQNKSMHSCLVPEDSTLATRASTLRMRWRISHIAPIAYGLPSVVVRYGMSGASHRWREVLLREVMSMRCVWAGSHEWHHALLQRLIVPAKCMDRDADHRWIDVSQRKIMRMGRV